MNWTLRIKAESKFLRGLSAPFSGGRREVGCARDELSAPLWFCAVVCDRVTFVEYLLCAGLGVLQNGNKKINQKL